MPSPASFEYVALTESQEACLRAIAEALAKPEDSQPVMKTTGELITAWLDREHAFFPPSAACWALSVALYSAELVITRGEKVALGSGLLDTIVLLASIVERGVSQTKSLAQEG